MKLLFLGDLLADCEACPEDVKEIGRVLQQKGCRAIVNFEGPLAAKGASKRKKRGPNVRQGKGAVDALLALCTAGACLANNHMMDYNEQGLFATLSALDKAGIAHTGAGCNLEDAAKPILLSDGGGEIAILNFGWKYEETVYATDAKPGCAALELDFVLRHIREERAKGRRVICVFHWGFEFNLYPMPYYRHFAYRCIDEGAELIVGHHPHNIQPFEEYKGHKIFYSLGNFDMGSLRDGFNTDFGIEGIRCYSDYGAGLIYDTESGECEGLSVVYDRETGTTALQGELAFEDISAIPYDSEAYREMAKKGIHGVNPMLTLDEGENEKILNKHLLVCQFYNAFKWVRKIPVFERAYALAKKIYTKG